MFGEHLKPKQHFVCHYGLVIKTSGNVVHMMNFRNEAKHKGFKEYAHIISSRKNVCFTLCMKAALQFANDLHNKTFFSSSMQGKINSCDLTLKHYFKDLPIPLPFNINQEIRSAQSISIKGCEFKVETFITISNADPPFGLYEIIDLLITSTDELFIVGRQWLVGEIDEHFLSYTVEEVTDIFSVYSINDIDGPPIMIHNINNKQLFRKKSDFSIVL